MKATKHNCTCQHGRIIVVIDVCEFYSWDKLASTCKRVECYQEAKEQLSYLAELRKLGK